MKERGPHSVEKNSNASKQHLTAFKTAFNTLCTFMRSPDLAHARRSDAAVGAHVSV